MLVTLPISNKQIEISQVKPHLAKNTIDTLSNNSNSNVPFVYRATKKFIEDLNISSLSIKDIEYAILVRMALSNKDTKLKTNTICPNCNGFNKILDIDIQDLPVNKGNVTKTIKCLSIEELKSLYPIIKIESKEEYEKRIKDIYDNGIVRIRTNLDDLKVKSMTFHLPSLEELCNSEQIKPEMFTENLMLYTLDNIEYEYEGQASVESWTDVKSRFGYQLFKFDIEYYYELYKSLWNDTGIITSVEYKCNHCNYSAVTTFDFISFFVFSVLPKDMKQ